MGTAALPTISPSGASRALQRTPFTDRILDTSVIPYRCERTPSFIRAFQTPLHLNSLIWEHLEEFAGTRIRQIAAENMNCVGNVFNIFDASRVGFERPRFGVEAEDTGNSSVRVVGSSLFRTR